MKSYLLSWLTRQSEGLDRSAFERAHPGPWLVWEPGPWQPPPSDRATMVSLADGQRRAGSGDALVLEVAPRPGRARFEGVRLGRGPENDLVVEDGTLSRAHLLFRQDDGWTVEDLRSSNGTRLDDVPLEHGPARLSPGTRLQAGAVRLTFYDADGLYLRLKHGAA